MQVKKAIRYAVILLLTAGLNQACEAQSKEETLQWIKLRLPYATATKTDLAGINTDTLGYHDVVVNGCSLSFVKKETISDYEGAGNKGLQETVITVPLGRLSVVDSVHGADDDWEGDSVELKAFDKIIAMKWTIQKSDNNGRPTGTESGSARTSEFDVVTSDRDFAKRLAKALAHANELCGAKKETF